MRKSAVTVILTVAIAAILGGCGQKTWETEVNKKTVQVSASDVDVTENQGENRAQHSLKF